MNILLSLSEAIIENRQGCLGSWVEFDRVVSSWFQLHWCCSTDPEWLFWHCKKWTQQLLSRNSLLGVVIGWAPQFLWLTNGKHPLLLIVRNLWIFLKFRRRKKCSLCILDIESTFHRHRRQRGEILKFDTVAFFSSVQICSNLKLVSYVRSMHFHITISTGVLFKRRVNETPMCIS